MLLPALQTSRVGRGSALFEIVRQTCIVRVLFASATHKMKTEVKTRLLYEARLDSSLESIERVAFAEGSAARTVLLDFLPLRTGLLPFRLASREARSLVATCKLKTQKYRSFADVSHAAAFCAAFPLAVVKLRVEEAQPSKAWLLALAKLSNVALDFSSMMASRAVMKEDATYKVLKALKGKCVSITAEYVTLLTDAGLACLADGITTVSLASKRNLAQRSDESDYVPWIGVVRFTLKPVGALRSLRSLSLGPFRARNLGLQDILPLAKQLHTLQLQNCPGVQDLSTFTGLHTLSLARNLSDGLELTECDYMFADEDETDLLEEEEKSWEKGDGRGRGNFDPALLPLQLRTLTLCSLVLSAPWTSLAAMTKLQELTLEDVGGLTAETFHLPPALTGLHIIDGEPLTWPGYRRCGQVKHFTYRPSSLHPRDTTSFKTMQEYAAAMANIACMVNLETLEFSDLDTAMCIFPPMPQLRRLTALFGSPTDLHWLMTHAPVLEHLQVEACVQASGGNILGPALQLYALRSFIFCRTAEQGPLRSLLHTIYTNLVARHGALMRMWVSYGRTCHLRNVAQLVGDGEGSGWTRVNACRRQGVLREG